MALADRIKQPPAGRQGLPCSIGELLADLPPAEREALETMLGTPDNRSPWSARQIYDALRDEGHTVGFQTINRHRGRHCRCFTR